MARRITTLAVAACLLGALPGCKEDTFPERRRTTYGSFEDEVYAIIEREFEVIEPRDRAPARIQLLRSQTDDERDPGAYVRDALQAAVRPPVDLDLRQSLENDTALSLFDDGGMRQLGEFISVSLGRMLDSTRPGGHAARVPQALAKLNRAAGGPNPDAVMHLLHRMASVERVTIPSSIPLGGDPELEEVSASLVPGMVSLYERQGDAVERLHVWLAGELQAYGVDDSAGAPDVGGAPTVDPIWERVVEPICTQLSDLGVKADCESDLALLELGAAVRTVDVDTQGAPVRTAEGVNMGDIDPFANVPQGTERRGTDPLFDQAMAFDPLTGAKAFRYQDAKGSLASLMIDSQRRMVAKGYLWDIARVVPLLMGAAPPRPNEGYAPKDNVLLDLLWALKELRKYPRWPILLKVQAELFDDGEGLRQLRDVLSAFGRARSFIRGVEILTPKNELFDHLAGSNPLRDLEVGKRCGHPSEADDLCSSHWLRCEYADADPAPMDSGTCKLWAKDPEVTVTVPSLLEELAEPGGWISRGGAFVPEAPILRKLFRAMSEDARLLTMSEGMAQMMENSVHNDLSAVVNQSCDDLGDGSIRDLHSQGYASQTQWDQAEGQPDPRGLADDGDPTRSMNQKLMDLIYDTNRAPFDPLVAGREETGILLIANQAAMYMDAAADNVDLSAQYLNGLDDMNFLEESLSGVADDVLCETGLLDNDDEGLTPTTDQLDLFMLRDHTPEGFFSLETGNPRGNLGFELRTRLTSALVAGTNTGNLESLKPIIQVISRYGQQFDGARNIRLPGGRTQLLLDTLSTLHMHYSEHDRNKDRGFDVAGLRRPDFDRQFGTGFRRAERYAVQMIRDPRSNVEGQGRSDLFTALTKFGGLLDRFEVCLQENNAGGCEAGRTVNAADEMVHFAGWLLDRDASAMVRPRPQRYTDWGVVDGQADLLNGPMTARRNPTQREPRPSRLYMVVDAFRLIDDRLEQYPDAALAWEHLDLFDLLTGVDPTTGALANPGTPWATRGLVRLMSELEERSWRDAGCDPWDPKGGTSALTAPAASPDDLTTAGCAVYNADLDVKHLDTIEFFSTPGLASALQLLGNIRNDDELRRWVDTLMAINATFDADPDKDPAGGLVELAAHTLRIAADEEDVQEVVRYLGAILEADAWLGKRLVPTLGRLHEADGDRQAVPALMRNLTTEDRTRTRSRFPLRTLKDLIADALKDDPLAQEPFTAADYRRVVERLKLYFVDDVRGFQRMVDVVVSRLPRP